MQRDLTAALAGKLREIFGSECVLFYGRVRQGQREPCFYLLPQTVERRLLNGGRVWRRVVMELHYYPADRDDPDEQIAVGEKVLRGLAVLEGAKRSYRGQDMSYCPGSEYLRCRIAYEYYTTADLEAEESGDISLMEILQIF